MPFSDTAAAVTDEQEKRKIVQLSKTKIRTTTTFGEILAFKAATNNLTLQTATLPAAPAQVGAKEALAAGGGRHRAAGDLPPRTAEGRPCAEGADGAGGGDGAISMSQLDQYLVSIIECPMAIYFGTGGRNKAYLALQYLQRRITLQVRYKEAVFCRQQKSLFI